MNCLRICSLKSWNTEITKNKPINLFYLEEVLLGMKSPNLDKKPNFIRRVYEDCILCDKEDKGPTYFGIVWKKDPVQNTMVDLIVIHAKCGNNLNMLLNRLGYRITTNFIIPFRDIRN